MTDNKDDKSLINTGTDNDITNIETIKDKVDRFGQKIIALYIERKLTIAEIAFKLFGSVSGYIRQAISDYLTESGRIVDVKAAEGSFEENKREK